MYSRDHDVFLWLQTMLAIARKRIMAASIAMEILLKQPIVHESSNEVEEVEVHTRLDGFAPLQGLSPRGDLRSLL